MDQCSNLFTDEGTDEIYEAIRKGINDRCRTARRFVDGLWEKVGRFLDPDFPSTLRQQFHQHFWELYLAAALDESELELQEQGTRKGPDLFCHHENNPIWVEATAVEPGKGDDRVAYSASGECRDIPDDQIKLRLMNGIEKKLLAYTRYVEKSFVDKTEPFAIAVNSGAVPYSYLEREVPRILRVLFPVGDEIVHLDHDTLKTIGRSCSYKPKVFKISGAGVPTTIFQDLRYSGISAIIHSCTTAFNLPALTGADFVVVHNPLARNPISHNFFQRGSVYWADTHLNCHVWQPSAEKDEMPDGKTR